MKLWSQSFDNGARIPERFAFGKYDAEHHVALSDNINPHLAWEEVPSETKSLALVCIDVDVPTRPDDVNQEGRMIPKDLPRTEFCHLLLVDLDPNLREIKEGLLSHGVTARGKQAGLGHIKGRQGLNDYTMWFQNDQEMSGQYFGYDGPCPPWNDSVTHHYWFRVLALSVAKLDLPEVFSYSESQSVIAPHVIDQAEWMGTYSLNPILK